MKRSTQALIAMTAFLALCAASRLSARWHPYGDPHWSQGSPRRQNGSIPEPAQSLLLSKCAACHSDDAARPSYGNYAPISWLLERDVVRARERLDLTQWDSLNGAQRAQLALAISSQAHRGRMPPPQYTVVHWNARLTPSDIANLDRWSQSLLSQRATPGDDSAISPADRGKLDFQDRCAGCHSLNRNSTGPMLAGVTQRKSGQAPGYNYSKALKDAAIPWTDENLDKWLADPDALVSGNKMDAEVDDAVTRKDIIAYLEQIPAP